MIIIDTERCTGCGACLEVCPTGALYLVDGRATLDSALCRECEACLAACPNGAIILSEQENPMAEAVRLPAFWPEGHGRPALEVIRVRTQSAPLPLRARVLPIAGAALAWAGREILPRLADLMLDTLDRHTTRLSARNEAHRRETLASGARGGGRQQHRHRRRGGG